jgi:hypothetical protein
MSKLCSSALRLLIFVRWTRKSRLFFYLTSFSTFLIAYKNRHFLNMQYSGQKVFFFKKIFFNYFSTLISKIFSRIFFFSRYEFWSSDVFKTIFRKNTFINIFLNTKSKNVRFSQDTLFLMLSKKK